ncbi:MAG: Rossmann-like and DUF2520 domain-containing protein [Bacteroidota bacterium]
MAAAVPSIVLIGAGRVGMNVLRHLSRLGIPVAAVIERDSTRHPLIRALHPAAAVAAVLPDSLPVEAQLCMIAVADGQLPGVVRELSELTSLPEGIIFFHSSGTLDSSILMPLSDRGCMTGCIHPMQSFSGDDLPDGALSGIGCGIEGNDDFWLEGRQFAKRIEWQPLRIDREKKALYHVANVLAGNFPIVLAALAEGMLRESATDPSQAHIAHFLPMMRTVLERLADTPAATALTGPAARGDHDAILRHLAALEVLDPQLREVYDALTRAAMKLGEKR